MIQTIRNTMIQNTGNELMLIIHSAKENDKKAQAFAASLPGYQVKVKDLKREDLTETQIAEIAGMMKVPIKDMVDTTYEDAGKHDTHVEEMEDQDILTALAGNRRLLKTPIVMFGDGRCFHLSTSYDLAKIRMDFGDHADDAV